MAEELEKTKHLGGIESITKEEQYYKLKYTSGEEARVHVLNNHVFKYHMSPTGDFPEYPQPDDPKATGKITAKSISDYGFEYFEKSHLLDHDNSYIIDIKKITIIFDKSKGTMTVTDKRSKNKSFEEYKPLCYDNNYSKQTLIQHLDEYFFGGGMQNGRFTHKGEVIKIFNTNKWDDGGVTSPCPFYWSTRGYGVLRNTWQPGTYDFGSKDKHSIQTIHNSEAFDAFFFINPTPRDLLRDYYELTGQPILLPEYAFYEAHLNTFNRDYWVLVEPDTAGSILFEDGHTYKKYQPSQMHGKVGILESLNGEKFNYQFSARAMIDRYNKHDLPLGWFIPNDGYGSGYGQTESLDGDIQNLKEFGDYARKRGVELAVWTESNLHPADPKNPKKGERDLNKEVHVAGVMALKADVAWIGAGYSFGLSAMQNAAQTFLEASKHALRPMIITVDGWAGTQHCAGVWSGDQYGGEWEYIRFHIPTYIGSGLSGLPNIGSDMDGIYYGGNVKVHIRDFQWKTFTPIQLNMDGWGRVQKTPFAFGREATCINRAYLKLKSMLMPYNYTLGYESTQGLPMIRAMALEFPNHRIAYTKDSQYQFMWGPNLLIAPIYNDKEKRGVSIRNGIFLPESDLIWIDFLAGGRYKGGKIYNNYNSPLWKIPIFVKNGAIIPMCNPNNNHKEIRRDHRILLIYPHRKSNFSLYEDDGNSNEYLKNNFACTDINVHGPHKNNKGFVEVDISKVKGNFEGIVRNRSTELIVSATDYDDVKVAINGENVALKSVNTKDDYDCNKNVIYFDKQFVVNPFLTETTTESLQQPFLLIKLDKINVCENDIQIKINGYANNGTIIGLQKTSDQSIEVPSNFTVNEDALTSNSITLSWNKIENAVGYEVERDGDIFYVFDNTTTTFEDCACNSTHVFRVRTVTENAVSNWSKSMNVTTKDDPYKNVVKIVQVKCSLPCQEGQEICNLTTRDFKTIWHTNWSDEGKIRNQKLELKFEFDNILDIDKFEYTPREDAGNGTILKLQYSYSVDNVNWSELSNVNWKCDSSTKTVVLDKQFKFFYIYILESAGNFGSGRALLFYRKEK